MKTSRKTTVMEIAKKATAVMMSMIMIAGAASVPAAVGNNPHTSFGMTVSAAANQKIDLGTITIYQTNGTKYKVPEKLCKQKLSVNGIDYSKINWNSCYYVTVSEDGTVTAVKTGTKSKYQYCSDVTVTGSYSGEYNEKNGTYSVSFKVNVVNYGIYYAKQVFDKVVRENIKPGMSEMEKLNVICTYISENYSYAGGVTASPYGMVEYGKGDCWAHTGMVTELCERAGLKVKERNDNINRSHFNNIVLVDNIPYEVETSYSNRLYTINRAKNYEYQDFNGETILTSVSSFGETLIVPQKTSNGKKIDSITGMVLNGSDTGKYIQRIVIQSNIKEIPIGAFSWNKSLREVILAPGVEAIDSRAFTYCPALRYVTIPSTVKAEIDKDVFTGSPDVTIRCIKGSYAHQFAEKNKIPVELITDEKLPAKYVKVKAEADVKDTKNYSTQNFSYRITSRDLNDDIFHSPDKNGNLLVIVKKNGKVLTEGKDYTIVFKYYESDNSVEYVVTGIGDYKGQAKIRAVINPEILNLKTMKKNIEKANVTLSYTSTTYTGSAKTPTEKVILGGTTLTKNTDYSVSYKNNVNAGKAEVTVTGRGQYSGKIVKTFTINSKLILQDSVSLNLYQFRYTDKVKKPTATVKDGSKILTLNKDYTVSYKDNINAGKGTVIIKGKGNYTGTVNKSITILPRTVSQKCVKLSYTETTYAGNGKRPSVTVTYDNTLFRMKLIRNRDYTVTYKNNINAGTATAIIICKGNFSGTVYCTYKIKVLDLSKCKISVKKTSAKYPSISVMYNGLVIPSSDYRTVFTKTSNGKIIATITGQKNLSGKRQIICK